MSEPEKCRDCGDVLGSNSLCKACNEVEAQGVRPKYISIPITIYGMQDPSIPEQTRRENERRANAAIETMNAADRAVMQQLFELRRRSSDGTVNTVRRVLDEDANECFKTIDYWLRRHEAAQAELHAACCNRPTHASVAKVLAEQL